MPQGSKKKLTNYILEFARRSDTTVSLKKLDNCVEYDIIYHIIYIIRHIIL